MKLLPGVYTLDRWMTQKPVIKDTSSVPDREGWMIEPTSMSDQKKMAWVFVLICLTIVIGIVI